MNLELQGIDNNEGSSQNEDIPIEIETGFLSSFILVLINCTLMSVEVCSIIVLVSNI